MQQGRRLISPPAGAGDLKHSCCRPLHASHSNLFHYRLKIDTKFLRRYGELCHIILKPDKCWSAGLHLCSRSRIESLLQLAYCSEILIVMIWHCRDDQLGFRWRNPNSTSLLMVSFFGKQNNIALYL